MQNKDNETSLKLNKNTYEDGGDKSPSKNILKVRDDVKPFEFHSAEDGTFKPASDQNASWVKQNIITNQDLQSRIEPWLTSLFQSEHLSLLIGSGLTTAMEHESSSGSQNPMENFSFTIFEEHIENAAKESASRAGREDGNIEDRIRVANELLRGLEILRCSSRARKLRNDLQSGLKEFAKKILASEKAIATASNLRREQAFNLLVSFLMSFASRTGTRDRLNIFTTNYDRLIEVGAELAGLHLIDRFVGNISPIFRSSRLDFDMHYNPPGIRGEPRYLEGVARFTKLHGSVDWVQSGDDIRRMGLPFGATDVKPYLSAPGLDNATAHDLMIFPNAAKDRETAAYPYVDLFRDLAAAISRPNNTLVTYGYSFGDEHINRVIRDMLTIPSTHLVVIAYDDKSGRIMKTFEELGRPSQISLLIGSALADLEELVLRYLPKPAIDKATFRMSELLTRRLGASESEKVDSNTNSGKPGASSNEGESS